MSSTFIVTGMQYLIVFDQEIQRPLSLLCSSPLGASASQEDGDPSSSLRDSPHPPVINNNAKLQVVGWGDTRTHLNPAIVFTGWVISV